MSPWAHEPARPKTLAEMLVLRRAWHGACVREALGVGSREEVSSSQSTYMIAAYALSEETRGEIVVAWSTEHGLCPGASTCPYKDIR